LNKLHEQLNESSASTYFNALVAKAIGLTDAIVLTQIHREVAISKFGCSGQCWVRMSYPQWQKLLPFLSISTIKKTILSLERQGILTGMQPDGDYFEESKSYTINYGTLYAVVKTKLGA
jgi:hypothetical protein